MTTVLGREAEVRGAAGEGRGEAQEAREVGALWAQDPDGMTGRVRVASLEKSNKVLLSAAEKMAKRLAELEAKVAGTVPAEVVEQPTTK